MRSPGLSRRAYLYAAAAAGASLLLSAGCQGGGGGGGRGGPGELEEISADEYDELVDVGDLPEGRRETGAGDPGGTVEEYERGGSLAGTGDKDSFVIVARHDEVEVVFEWPEGEADFGVKVYGKDGDELGDFDLDDGEVIQLFGRDKFTLEIYSKGGRGTWRATYED